jgi:hypothetical protein
MATLTLPIMNLMPTLTAVEETQGVLVQSREDSLVGLVWTTVVKTFKLRRLFAELVAQQEGVINALMDRDFAADSLADIKPLASSLGTLVRHEQHILDQFHGLNSAVQFLLGGRSISKFSDQKDHLESFAETLAIESNAEASALLAFAAGQVANR